MLAALGANLDSGTISRLPFSDGDTTAGVENELQAVVIGAKEKVDLPLYIENSNYFSNIIKREHRGDLTSLALNQLRRYLDDNPGEVWENSWVRFPLRLLNRQSRETLETDLLADKKDPSKGNRSDRESFFIKVDGEPFLRIPISYLLKLSLIQAVHEKPETPASLRRTAMDIVDCFINDNTSPETKSFFISTGGSGGGPGKSVALETAKRFLLIQLLNEYAGRAFALTELGQRVLVYFAPHTPLRQKELNGCISDAFYRELFMSPCLSGWDKGEEKHRYMHLCHEVLSRSQLNALAKMREAGIIANNLVVLPSTSNTSLANNGTHISIGSRRLGERMAAPSPEFNSLHEKCLGDLVIKSSEHFVPLFISTYAAAPYRMGFADFHPEIALGFLPHEMDYTHLRMLWRRWKKKADLKFFGTRLTPFGPLWLDNAISRILGLKGDFIPDYRLIDYLVGVLSTYSSPGLNGQYNNEGPLAHDLRNMGVFDSKMSLYMLVRQRRFDKMGFSGFEWRHYSQFAGLEQDLALAVDLQVLITALMYKLIFQGRLEHNQVPDDPETESERRQVVFDSAIRIPTFYVRKNSPNRLLMELIRYADQVRSSNRYKGYVRVHVKEYCLGLVRFLRREGPDLIEAMNAREMLDDLERRLKGQNRAGCLDRLTEGILNSIGEKDPIKVPPQRFNQATEKYYREELRFQTIRESLALVREEFSRSDPETWDRESSHFLLNGAEPEQLLDRIEQGLMDGQWPDDLRLQGILLLLFSIRLNTKGANPSLSFTSARAV